jgi:chromosome segregation ATPase
MEDLKVATAEESKCKQQEVMRLHSEIKKLSHARSEALDHQRGDLIVTYEQLMKQREEVYHKRENEIVTMISVLENKFEAIQTEALQVKAELRNTHTLYEQASNDLNMKNDQCRTLQYKYDDDTQALTQELIVTNKRVTELTSELDHSKLVASNEINVLKADISKVGNLHVDCFEEIAFIDDEHLFVAHDAIGPRGSEILRSRAKLQRVSPF